MHCGAEVCEKTGMRELWDLEVIGCDAVGGKHRGNARVKTLCISLGECGNGSVGKNISFTPLCVE